MVVFMQIEIWVAIVTVLMLATVFLLQWNRISFRTPLDMLAESRVNGGVTSTRDHREAGQVMSTTTAADPRTGGLVSIMVMYRPPPGAAKTGDLPPTYDSLFLGENPPGYNMLTVNLPTNGESAVPEDSTPADVAMQMPLQSSEEISLNTPTTIVDTEESLHVDEEWVPTSDIETEPKVEASSVLLEIQESQDGSVLTSDSAIAIDDEKNNTAIFNNAIVNTEEVKNTGDISDLGECSSMTCLQTKEFGNAVLEQAMV